MSKNLRKGLRYEDQARDFLQRQGLKPLESNFRSRFGEIDLVMLECDTVCFIEVKYRASLAFGGAATAIPRSKQRKIIKTALCYLATHPAIGENALRFDALLIQQHANHHEFDWIKSAFCAD